MSRTTMLLSTSNLDKRKRKEKQEPQNWKLNDKERNIKSGTIEGKENIFKKHAAQNLIKNHNGFFNPKFKQTKEKQEKNKTQN